jgi:large subunit ribosomal protein L17
VRHRSGHRKLGRTAAHRRALFRNLSTSIITNERVITTVEKAKEIRPIVEKLVTLAKTDSLHHRKQAHSYLQDKSAVHKLFTDIALRFKERPGGYLRITRCGFRAGDNAGIAQIEFLDDKYVPS